MDNRPRVRDACKRRMPLDGSDAQALEHALTMTERERDEARAEVKRLREECNRMSVDLAVARTEMALLCELAQRQCDEYGAWYSSNGSSLTAASMAYRMLTIAREMLTPEHDHG